LEMRCDSHHRCNAPFRVVTPEGLLGVGNFSRAPVSIIAGLAAGINLSS
jgi:hypothetical protein